MVAHSLIRSVLLLATTACASSVVQLQPGLRLRGGRSGGPLGRLPGVNLLAEQKEVLVTGGVGYIGSHTVLELLQANYRVVIVDNLCNSNLACLERVQKIAGKEVAFHNVDIRDKEGLAAVFAQHSVGAVIHFAGLKAVGESVAQPLMYYQVNVEGTLNLLEAMDDAGVGDIVFSSSATVYGDPATVPVTESFPTGPTNPYGHSKLFNEQILRDFAASRPEWNVCLLRYFNPVGAHPSGMIGEDPKGIPNNLMPYIQQVAVGKRPHLAVFGDDYPTADGTGVRDYIHVRAQIPRIAQLSPWRHNPLTTSTSTPLSGRRPRQGSPRRAQEARVGPGVRHVQPWHRRRLQRPGHAQGVLQGVRQGAGVRDGAAAPRRRRRGVRGSSSRRQRVGLDGRAKSRADVRGLVAVDLGEP